MSYLLRHAAAAEKVAMTAQGSVNITDLIKWLYHDIKVHVTMADITHIAQHDLKAQYKIVNGKICAVNGHSLSLPLMIFKPYKHKIGGHPRYLVHETSMKCLPAILKEGLIWMRRNYVHLSMQTGNAGLQQKSKPTIAIYVDVVRASAYGLVFHHCDNDVVMCSGDRKGIISPYFFDSTRNTQTWALIKFDRPSVPPRENMLGPEKVGEEVDLPPPLGATGFEPRVGLENESVLLVNEGRYAQHER